MNIKIFALTLTALGLSLGAFAQPGLKQESVSIFKNSTAFFVKSGQVTTKDKKWEIVGDTIPRALNGTFWLSSPTKEMSIAKSFIGETDEYHVGWRANNRCQSANAGGVSQRQ